EIRGVREENDRWQESDRLRKCAGRRVDPHYPRVNTAPQCAQNFAPSCSSAWHWPQARRDEATDAGAMLDVAMGAETDAGAIGIGRQRPFDAAGTASGNG